MIGGIGHGRSIISLLRYIFEKEQSQLLAHNTALTPADGLKSLASEFLAVMGRRRSVTKSVTHIYLSPNKLDDKTDEQLVEYAERYLQGMGYDNSPYVIAKHGDTGHEHLHIAVSSITYDGKVVDDSLERSRQMRLSRKLEKELGFVFTKYDADNKTVPKWQRERAIVPMDYIKDAIELVTATEPSFPDFIRGMQDFGIDVKATFAKDKIRLSYKFDDVAIKASDCGGSQKLLEQRHGVKYEPEQRDQIKEILESSKFDIDNTYSADELSNASIQEESPNLETPDEAGVTARHPESDSIHESRPQERAVSGTEAGDDVSNQERLDRSESELKDGLRDTHHAIDEDIRRLLEVGVRQVEDAAHTIESTNAVFDQFKRIRQSIVNVRDRILEARDTIVEFGNKVTRFLTNRDKRLEREAEQARLDDLKGLYSRLPKHTQSILETKASHTRFSTLDYLEKNRSDYERFASKNDDLKSQGIDLDDPKSAQKLKQSTDYDV